MRMFKHLLVVLCLFVLLGCQDEKASESLAPVVKTSRIAGERIHLSGAFVVPWEKSKNFVDIKSTCSCTQVTPSSLTMDPGSKIDVDFVFTSTGKPPKVHLFDLRAIDSEKEVLTLPIKFEVSLSTEIVFGNTFFSFSFSKEDEDTESIQISSELEIPSSSVSLDQLPPGYTFKWERFPSQNKLFYYLASVTRNNKLASIAKKFNHEIVLHIRNYKKLDRCFPLRLSDSGESLSIFERESCFLGKLSFEPKEVELNIRKGVSVSHVNVKGPAWLIVDSELLVAEANKDSLTLNISQDPQQKSTPPIAGYFNLTVECKMQNGTTVEKTIPVMYTSTSQPAVLTNSETKELD